MSSFLVVFWHYLFMRSQCASTGDFSSTLQHCSRLLGGLMGIEKKQNKWIYFKTCIAFPGFTSVSKTNNIFSAFWCTEHLQCQPSRAESLWVTWLGGAGAARLSWLCLVSVRSPSFVMWARSRSRQLVPRLHPCWPAADTRLGRAVTDGGPCHWSQVHSGENRGAPAF